MYIWAIHAFMPFECNICSPCGTWFRLSTLLIMWSSLCTTGITYFGDSICVVLENPLTYYCRHTMMDRVKLFGDQLLLFCRARKIPMIIRRYLPDGSYEDWGIDELIMTEWSSDASIYYCHHHLHLHRVHLIICNHHSSSPLYLHLIPIVNFSRENQF